jgi:hypothetical protein
MPGSSLERSYFGTATFDSAKSLKTAEDKRFVVDFSSIVDDTDTLFDN